MKFLSKTVLLNIATIVAGVGTYLVDSKLITDNPDLVAGIGIAVSVANLVLRYFTKSAMAGWFTKNA